MSPLLEWENLDFPDLVAIKSKSEKSFLNFTCLWFEMLQGDRLLVNIIRSRRGDKSKDHPTPFVSIQRRLHTDDATGRHGRGLSSRHHPGAGQRAIHRCAAGDYNDYMLASVLLHPHLICSNVATNKIEREVLP